MALLEEFNNIEMKNIYTTLVSNLQDLALSIEATSIFIKEGIDMQIFQRFTEKWEK